MLSKNNLTTSYLSLCVAIQIIIVLAQAFKALNMPSAAYDALLYMAFIACAILSFAVLKAKPQFLSSRNYLITEGIVTYLMVAAVFQSTIYDNSPWLANKAIMVMSVVALLIKLFWKEMHHAWPKVERLVYRVAPWSTWLAILSISILIYMPNLKAVLAEIFIGEQAHHLDFFVMSPGVSALHGGLPYVDVISQYGVGIPVLLSKLSWFFGGFDYLPILRLHMFFGIVYFVLFYMFTKRWLGSAVLAFTAFLVCYRLQMFHYGVSPLAWIYPSSTPMRFGLDILWLWLLWCHLSRGRSIFLLLAAAYSGFAVFYMTATGMFITMAFYVYLGGMFILDRVRKEQTMAPNILIWSALLPVIVGIACFAITLQKHVLSTAFWSNLMEYISYFSTGRGALPIYESLKYRHYWVAIMAVFIPLFYVATAIVLCMQLWFKNIDRKYWLVVVIAIYGLVNYQYFVVRSALTSYYINAVPFVLISAFWVTIILKKLSPEHAKRVRWGLLMLAAFALFTNHNYLSYPNMLNVSSNPMIDIKVAQRFPDRQGYFHHQVKNIKENDKVMYNAAGNQDEQLATEDSFKNDRELIDFVHKAYDFSIDAALIQGLTQPKEPVAILSSFETKLLVDAKRSPFFYHTPLLTSMPMQVRYFPNDAAHSPNFLTDTIGQLERVKPSIVFIENVYLQNYPASYKDSHVNVLPIVEYITTHYTPYKRGQYLTAMKRR